MSVTYTPSNERLLEIEQLLRDDPQYVYQLTPEEAISMQSRLNPMGNIANANQEFASMTLVNWRDEYLKKFHTTALIAYIFRLQAEYNPEDELEQERLALEEKLAAQPTTQHTALRAESAARSKLITDTARRIVRKFLERNFKFNPDKHLQTAHTTNAADPERKDKSEMIRAACAVADKAAEIDAKLEQKPAQTYAFLRSNVLACYSLCKQAMTELQTSVNVIGDNVLSVPDRQGILIKKYQELNRCAVELGKIAQPIATAETLAALTIDPPKDVFHQYTRFYTNHYEQLREVVQAVYNEKPDVEFSIQFYRSHKSESDATTFRNQYEGTFHGEVLCIDNQGVTLLGPFKENRNRVGFYNKNVSIMKKMMEQMETDHKLGKDLMAKEVRRKKKQNIREHGPDAPGLSQYSAQNNPVLADGGKQLTTKEEREKMQRAAEDAMVPEDAIQMDMFFTETGPDGEPVLKRGIAYTQAEAPLHLQENSEFHAQYQPKREDGPMIEQYRTKTIVSKTGQKIEVQELIRSQAPASASTQTGKDKDEL